VGKGTRSAEEAGGVEGSEESGSKPVTLEKRDGEKGSATRNPGGSNARLRFRCRPRQPRPPCACCGTPGWSLNVSRMDGHVHEACTPRDQRACANSGNHPERSSQPTSSTGRLVSVERPVSASATHSVFPAHAVLDPLLPSFESRILRAMPRSAKGRTCGSRRGPLAAAMNGRPHEHPAPLRPPTYLE